MCIIEDNESDIEPVTEVNSEQSSRITSFIVAFLLKFQILFKISDSAIVLLLRFFKYLLVFIGTTFQVEALNEDLDFPKSLHGCQSLLGISHTSFKEYVVCSKCHSLFDPTVQKLIEGTGSNRRSIQCKFVSYPNHPQARFRAPCNTVLMRTVKTCKNTIKFRARKTFCYYGFKAALVNFLNRPGFLTACNSWNERLIGGDLMYDIIDGKVWTEELGKLVIGGNMSNVLAFLINIDWFQPFKDTSYSVGVIYAVILNLPRGIRYKGNNVIIVGIIPGPKEPKHDVNSYLGPMVGELLELYSGIWVQTPLGKQYIRGILLCFSSDIPATRV